MADAAAHVTMLQRSPTYITTLPAKDPIADVIRHRLPERWSGPIIRWFKALTTQASYVLSQSHPKLVKRLLRLQLERQLPDGYDIDTHFTPSYDPWDQRLCVVPDGDLFKAIRRGTVSVVTDHIDRFTEHGIRLRSGAELEADVVVTATGLDLLFLGGVALTVDGEAVDVASKLTYKGMMLEGVPNLAVAIGYTNASWTLKCDLTCDYVCRLLNRMRATGETRCMAVNHDATVTAQPLLGLTSGYVTRATDRFPKQGTKAPWQVRQSYLRDYRALKMGDVADDTMEFSRPNPRPVPAAAAS
jgi:monooxygenase